MCEPFLGTGTFISQLLLSGLIKPEDLEYKYKHEIFANEIVLLSYYIASINIESVYRQIRKEQGQADRYTEFEGIALTDTFQINEGEDQLARFGDLAENSERVKRQKEQDIRVVVMNPPYSAGQKSANDNNQNLKYPTLDRRIENTYVKLSTGTNKNSLYDSYYRALRWATDRIGDAGVIGMVSNSSFVDGNSAEGVRLTLQDEFDQIYIFNLKGNQRTQGEQSRREGGKIFGSGSRAGIAISIFIKNKANTGPATIHYAEVDDYLSQEEKLQQIEKFASISVHEQDPAGGFTLIEPNTHGDWINQRDEKYGTYQPIGDKKTKGKPNTPGLFRNYSRGLATTRDAWCYNFSTEQVASNMSRMIDNYNKSVDSGVPFSEVNRDGSFVSWGGNLNKDFERGIKHTFAGENIRPAIYRPFCKQPVYFDRSMNERVYQLPQLFPTPKHANIGILISTDYRRDWGCFITQLLPDLSSLATCQIFSLYTWEKKESEDGGFNLEAVADNDSVEVDGYTRRDNITDATLNAYRTAYADETIGKEDIFYYVYALLSHPQYRENYGADLKKMLPRIPKVEGFWEYSQIGRDLADLHLNYEQAEKYGLHLDWSLHTPEDPWAKYRVEKPRWQKRSKHDAIIFNDYLTISGIPEKADEWKIGGRSPLEWVLDRYRVTTHKASGIVNDPNDYCREVNKPSYIVDLIQSLVTVSLTAQDLLAELPALKVIDNG